MSQLKRLLSFIRPYSLRFVVAVVLMAAVGACEAIRILLIQPVFDRVLDPRRGLRAHPPLPDAVRRPKHLFAGFPSRMGFTTSGRWWRLPSLR